MIIYMAEMEDKNDFATQREQMVRLQLRGRDITDPAVLEVMGHLRREEFLPEQYQSQSYEDGPVPIGLGQTISQPYIVALMSQELKVTGDSEVLEIGTGSGYQAAVLAALAKKVYTIERHEQLSQTAQATLGRLGIKNVEFCIGDGTRGWPDDKQFDRIMITAAATEVPQPLVEQLVEGGLAVMPLGAWNGQDLVLMQKTHGRLKRRTICGCRFVRLIGEYGYEEE